MIRMLYYFVLVLILLISKIITSTFKAINNVNAHEVLLKHMQQHKYDNAGTIFCQLLYAIYDS